MEPRVLLSALNVQHLPGTEMGTNASVSVSDDGGRIAFVSDANLTGQNTELRPAVFYFDTANSMYTQVSDVPSVTSDAVMSGDGRRIAFVTAANLVGQNADGNFEVYLYDIPSQTTFQLTNTLDPLLEDTPDKTNLWLSDNGSRLMYRAYRTDIATGGVQHQVIRVTSLTTTPTSSVAIDFGSAAIGFVADLAYSRDGSHVAVDSSRDLTGSGRNADGNLEIFLYDVRTTVPSVTQVTNTQAGSNSYPTLNGDGSRIAFSSDIDFEGGGPPLQDNWLYLHEIGSTSFVQVPNTARGGLAALDADGIRLVSQNAIGSFTFYDSVEMELVFVGGGTGLPLPAPVPPDSPGIPPVIPIVEGLNATAISASASILAFSGFVEDENFERTSGVFFATRFPPVVDDNFVTTPEDTNVEFNVLFNDSDPNGGSLTVLTIGGEEAHGRVTFNNNGKLIYRPDDNFSGTDSFTYVAENSAGLKTRGTVFVDVLPVNDPPVAVAEEFEFDEDQAKTVLGPGVLRNDTDVERDPLTARLVNGPGHGTLVLSEDGGFVYRPDENFHGTDSFVYVAHDGVDDSAETVVTLKVLPVNDGPANSLPDPITAFEDVSAPIRGITVTDIDAAQGAGVLQVTLHVESGSLTVDELIVGGLAAADIQGNGTSTVVLTGLQDQINASLAADGGLTYVGLLDFSGSDLLSITTSDLGNFGFGGPLTAANNLEITVLSSAEQAERIAGEIAALPQTSLWKFGEINSLSQKIQGVLDKLEAGQDAVAVNRLWSLANEIHALAISGRISQSEEETLLGSIETLVVSITTQDAIEVVASLRSISSRNNLRGQQPGR